MKESWRYNGGIFPDKKKSYIDDKEIDRLSKLARSIKENAEVGQKEATWIPQLEYEDKPMLLLYLTDVHYPSMRTDIDLLNHYLKIVDEVPNVRLATGGDDVDNFNVGMGAKMATGTYENPIEPGIQSKGWQMKMQRLDRKGKIGFMVFGNHTDWTYVSGNDWYDTFLGGMEAPLLTTGGIVRMQFRKGAKYEIAATHKYWGTSKLNPTNACKRYLEHEYPTADAVMMGHTHQSEVLHFERGGKDRVALIGGTLKLYEDYARKHGIGGRAGQPGHCISFWTDHREMQPYKNFERAIEEHIKRL